MAMSGQERRGSPGDLSYSLVQGSDVLPDVCCDVCSEDGRQLEAEGFCVDCSDYLCRDCCRGHRRNRLSRHHHLQDKASMPCTRPAGGVTSQPSQDACTEACERHPDRIAEYFCQNHEQLGCGVCMTVKHRTCEDVDHIPDLAQGLLNSDEYKQYEERLSDLNGKAVKVVNVSKENIKKTETCSSDTVQKVLKLQNDMNALFDSVVDSVRSQCDSKKEDDIKMMKAVEDAGTEVLNDTKRIASKADALKELGQLCQLFIYMKKTQDGLKEMGITLDETETRNKVTEYFYQPSNAIQDILAEKERIGQVRIGDQKITPPIAKNLEELTVSHTQEINIKTAADQNMCLISGIATLSDNKLVIADRENRKVKVADICTSSVIAELTTERGPWDIAPINDTQVAVTLPEKNEIAFVETSRSLKVVRKINVGDKCRGIAYSNGILIVTFETGYINSIGLDGTVLHKCENRGFHWLSHAAYSPENGNVYLSDLNQDGGCVVCITPTCHEKFTKKIAGMSGLRGIATDQLGRIWTCGQHSGNVAVLNPDASKNKILVNGMDRPTGLGYCNRTNRLFIGCYKRNSVSVYQV